MGEPNYVGIFPFYLNVPDIHRFPTMHVTNTYFLLENLPTSEPSFRCTAKIPTAFRT